MDLAATTLFHARVRLEPFEECHRAGLIAAAADPAIWLHIPFPVVGRGYSAWFDILRAEQLAGRWLPYAVIALIPPPPLAGEVAKRSERAGASASCDSTAPLPQFASLTDTSPARGGGKIVGQSCYINARAMDSCVEIGGTWYAPEAQATLVNPAAKLLLLGHAFDSGAERVELKTDALNARSRAAMEKLGCAFEWLRSAKRGASG